MAFLIILLGIIAFMGLAVGFSCLKDKAQDKKFTLISLCVGMLAAVSIVAIFANMHIQSQKEKANKPQEDNKTLYCDICGGKIECEICGDIDALYCEYASYGSGDDHYCQKHWADVVEWHEKK